MSIGDVDAVGGWFGNACHRLGFSLKAASGQVSGIRVKGAGSVLQA